VGACVRVDCQVVAEQIACLVEWVPAEPLPMRWAPFAGGRSRLRQQLRAVEGGALPCYYPTLPAWFYTGPAARMPSAQCRHSTSSLAAPAVRTSLLSRAPAVLPQHYFTVLGLCFVHAHVTRV